MKVMRGFTLFELIVVILVLGILGAGVSAFMGNTVQLFNGVVQREQLMNESRFVVTRMTKEIQQAIPNSLRISGNSGVHCLEFVPVQWLAAYAHIPVLPTSDRIMDMVFPIDADGLFHFVAFNQYVVINPLVPSHVYDLNQNRRARVLNCSDDGDGRCPTRDDSDDVIQVQLSNAFAEASTGRHVYFASRTVSYCVSAGVLYRKEDALTSTQSLSLNRAHVVATALTNTLSASPGTAPGSQDPFHLYPGSMGASNGVQIRLLFSKNDEQLIQFKEVYPHGRP